MRKLFFLLLISITAFSFIINPLCEDLNFEQYCIKQEEIKEQQIKEIQEEKKRLNIEEKDFLYAYIKDNKNYYLIYKSQYDDFIREIEQYSIDSQFFVPGVIYVEYQIEIPNTGKKETFYPWKKWSREQWQKYEEWHNSWIPDEEETELEDLYYPHEIYLYKLGLYDLNTKEMKDGSNIIYTEPEYETRIEEIVRTDYSEFTIFSNLDSFKYKETTYVYENRFSPIIKEYLQSLEVVSSIDNYEFINLNNYSKDFWHIEITFGKTSFSKYNISNKEFIQIQNILNKYQQSDAYTEIEPTCKISWSGYVNNRPQRYEINIPQKILIEIIEGPLYKYIKHEQEYIPEYDEENIPG